MLNSAVVEVTNSRKATDDKVFRAIVLIQVHARSIYPGVSPINSQEIFLVKR